MRLSSGMIARLMVFLAVAAASGVVTTDAAKIHMHRWDVRYEFKSPDCYKKLTITINGKSPGPTILAQQGDTVIVEVTNSLDTENLAIHWHGIRQIGSPWSDGAEGVTQCPIVPGDTFNYRFVVDRPGTYMYHAHYGMQREAGLYGSIQVSLPDGEVEPFVYDYDRSIILTDWYHNSTYEQAAGLSSVNFVWVGEPHSLLIQGRGRFNCSMVTDQSVCNVTNPECSPYFLTAVPGKVYRLRIGSLTALSALSFQIEGHNMTVVEADGHYVEPFEVSNLFIYSGETYSVLVKADQDPLKNYWMTTSIVSRNSTTPPALAILNYYPNHPRKPPPTPPPVGPAWNDVAARLEQSRSVKAHHGYIHTPPPNSDRAIVMLNTQNKINGRVRWSVNNVSHDFPTTPYLISMRKNIKGVFDQKPSPDILPGYNNYNIYSVANNTNATAASSIYRLKFNSTVDVILQNANTMTKNNSETHPWHLHGHDFWVLGYGTGKFDPDEDPQKYNLVNPIMKNTAPLHPFGWTALRFVANNPGVWAFHCHIESHFYMGMGTAFEEGIEKVRKLPSKIMGCGRTRGRKLKTIVK
ncbi:hypothetical protein MLD38_035643 [Melastoma candidum]|uniref:Uncharacterized protein n=1 Tax=Melastoma candidum TaxID=119954 RepID=A0ACB9LJ03_9MYRT|nr:hypothetical protein MLD38_035643 [Melastoma candidum]